MAKLSYVALLGLLSCLVEGATFIVGTTKPVTGSKAHRRAIAARDGGLLGAADGLLDILDLSSLLSGSGLDPGNILYHYSNAVTGFAAPMTQEQADTLAQHPDVLYVVRDTVKTLYTTRTPKFLGIEDSQALLGRGRRGLDLNLGVDLSLGDSSSSAEQYSTSSAGETDIVIGVLDTGAWPELASYNDEGFPAPPSHWKGQCVEGEDWTKDNCNNKLIGARYYYQGYIAESNLTESTFNESKSARADVDGHGVHTSTTAAGAKVDNVSLFGQASGSARGMALGARLAIYKVCWGVKTAAGCMDSDIAAALDDAIEDGVNILSLSLGGDAVYGISATDPIAQGAFRARQKGIHVFQSAANNGPQPFTVGSLAAWTFGVGASTLDRNFPAHAVLADGTNFTGVSIERTPDLDPTFKPLVDGQAYDFIVASDAAAAGVNATDAQKCLANSLDTAKVAGKIVVCIRGKNGRVEKGGVCRDAGAAGMVLYNAESNGLELIADAHLLPAVHLSYPDGLKFVDAVKAGAKGTLDFEGTVYGVPAPEMGSFSSRGPVLTDLSVMKPDVTAPGVSIFAGWSPKVAPSETDGDTYRTDYNIISGTSMSCPHVAGLAAWVQARRPNFTPAVIHSAFMTTAYTTMKGSDSPLLDTATGGPADATAYGNGHIDAVRALDPGLFYDITNDDWVNYACGQNSSAAFISTLAGTQLSCDTTKAIQSEELNYPSFSALYDTSSDTGTKEFSFPRTLTSLSGAGVYTAQLSAVDNPLVNVAVSPTTLTFAGDGDKQSYLVKVSMQGNATSTEDLTTAFGRLTWSDGQHIVGSSLSFLWVNVTSVVEQAMAAQS